MKTIKKCRGAALAIALGACAYAQAQTTPIQFNPNGTGATGAVSVATFDWTPNSSLALRGNPATGLMVGSKVVILSQASLGVMIDINGANVAIAPPGTEFTFVAGFGETVTTCTGSPCNNAALVFDPAELTQNFFEIWVKTTAPHSSNLDGTGFNTSKRILFGKVNDAFGNFAVGTCQSGSAEFLDQFNGNDWPGQQTICGSGSTQIAVQVLSADPDYFPGFTPAQIANLKAKFNTSTLVPFRQADPSRRFIANDAGVNGTDPQVAVISTNTLGSVNGLVDGGDHNFELQSDGNLSFEPGITVAGACRVTYGGNDRNGNIAPNSFGQSCMKDKGNQENCYTFGGQVGAPTANPAVGGPFGEHTHHQASGPAGDFVFRAGTHSAPDRTRITGVACKDPGACRQAEANAGFKQIDFEGTGSFRELSDTAKAYLAANGGGTVLPDNQDTRKYYFRVDMDDTGEPGDKFAKGTNAIAAAFLALDLNRPLSDPDPLLAASASCNQLADVYQFYICKDENVCEQAQAMYAVRGYLTGGNIQLHKVIK